VYESIRGNLIRREPASAVIEAAGLAYRLHVPLSTSEVLPPPGEEVVLKVHLVVREDEWKLFGFARDEERAVFRALLKVNGVGPVMALSLLSGFRPSEFQAAVAGGDVKALTRVKGVGKKTAERIIIELRDAWKDAASGGAGIIDEDATGPIEDAVRALVSLGIDSTDARKRVSKHVGDDPASADASDLIRKALRS
jgi:Holliday junction DNA helicase RuvA